jgi:hypothetical protein
LNSRDIRNRHQYTNDKDKFVVNNIKKDAPYMPPQTGF